MATNTTETKTNGATPAEVKEAVAPGEKLISKAKANKKLIMGISIGLGACLVGGLVWFFVARAGASKAAEEVAKADMAYIKAKSEQNPQADSIALPLYLKAAEAGYDSGDRAHIMAGAIYYKKGKYEEALKQFEAADVDGEIVEPGIYIARGNCYANLKKYDEALKCFKKAEAEADGNAAIAPYALVKQANVYNVQKNYKEEAACYERIINEYPEYVANPYFDIDATDPAAANFNDGANRDIERYYERAKALAGGK